jgi:virginiamycin A acetyltransferase
MLAVALLVLAVAESSAQCQIRILSPGSNEKIHRIKRIPSSGADWNALEVIAEILSPCEQAYCFGHVINEKTIAQEQCLKDEVSRMGQYPLVVSWKIRLQEGENAVGLLRHLSDELRVIAEPVRVSLVTQIELSPAFEELIPSRDVIGTVLLRTGRGSHRVAVSSIKIVDIFDWNFHIGQFASINPQAQFLFASSRGPHRIDQPSTFAFDLLTMGQTHYLDSLESSGQVPPLAKRTMTIGNDVWIGYGARLINAVTIGHGAVVGAYAVVREDVPPYAIVIGNPAQVVRYRFPPETIAELLRIAWWDWPEEVILRQMPRSENISALIEFAAAREREGPLSTST